MREIETSGLPVYTSLDVAVFTLPDLLVSLKAATGLMSLVTVKLCADEVCSQS